MSAELRSTSENGTMVLTIHNAAQRNALGPEIYTAGIEALEGAENNSDVRTVVIVGEGAWFSAGGSLPRLQANRQRDPSAQAESIARTTASRDRACGPAACDQGLGVGEAGVEERLLAAEVVAHQPGVDACGAGDSVQRGPREALSREALARPRQDLLRDLSALRSRPSLRRPPSYSYMKETSIARRWGLRYRDHKFPTEAK